MTNNTLSSSPPPASFCPNQSLSSLPTSPLPTGEEFTQLFQHYPILEPLYTNFEKNYNALSFQEFLKANPLIPCAIVTAYMAFCYFGQKYMKDKKAFDLKMPLAYWNLFLSTFSFMGMFRTVPHLLHNLATRNFQDNICQNPSAAFGDGACGFWVMLFVMSKIPELIDTFFIVARKKNLIFLHWYVVMMMTGE